MVRVWLIVLGGIATLLAVVGAVLPGLPTTPFVLVALWAFARSSDRLYSMLERIPILKHGLAEANRFEQRGAIRLPIKILSLTMAWGSAAATAYFSGPTHAWLTTVVVIAAVAATVSMIWIPTDVDD